MAARNTYKKLDAENHREDWSVQSFSGLELSILWIFTYSYTYSHP